MVKQGDVWLIRLDPTVGSEIQKTRPCLIVSPDELNDILRRAIIAPMTSGSHPAPFRVQTTFRQKSGLVLLDQLRTVDRNRMISKLGRLDEDATAQSLEILKRMFSQ